MGGLLPYKLEVSNAVLFRQVVGVGVSETLLTKAMVTILFFAEVTSPSASVM